MLVSYFVPRQIIKRRTKAYERQERERGQAALEKDAEAALERLEEEARCSSPTRFTTPCPKGPHEGTPAGGVTGTGTGAGNHWKARIALGRVVHEARGAAASREMPPQAVNRSGSVIREAAAPPRETTPLPRPPVAMVAPAGDDAPPDMVVPDSPRESVTQGDSRAAVRAERRAARRGRAAQQLTNEGDQQI